MEDDLECPICLDIFGLDQHHIKAPKILKCGDTFCKECLETIIKHSEGEYFLCPLCKENIKKEQNINDFTSNKKIISIVNSCFNIPKIDIQKEQENRPIQYNIISLGNSAVGKTSIFRRLSSNAYEENYSTTIGCDQTIYYIKYKSNKYKLIFHDPSGQEKYKSVTKSFLRNKDGVLFIFDISNEASFVDIESWYNLYKEDNEEVIGLLIGNKSDCERKIDEVKAKKFAEKHGLNYLETSAKLDKNIRKAIACLLERIIESEKMKVTQDMNESYISISSKEGRLEKNKNKKCNC